MSLEPTFCMSLPRNKDHRLEEDFEVKCENDHLENRGAYRAMPFNRSL